MLETQRLILREMTEADAADLLALGQNPNVTPKRMAASSPSTCSQCEGRARQRAAQNAVAAPMCMLTAVFLPA